MDDLHNTEPVRDRTIMPQGDASQSTLVMPQKRGSHTTLLLVGAAVVIAGIAIIFFYSGALESMFGSKSVQVPIDENVQEYKNVQTAADAASALVREGKRTEAQATLEQLYATLKNPIARQEALALMARNTIPLDITKAFSFYRALAADTTYTPEARAAAIEEMGLIHTLSWTSDTETATNALFAEEPYQSLRASTTDEAYRNLFVYANNIYPRILASAYIALHDAKAATTSNSIEEGLRSLDDALVVANDESNQYRPLGLLYKGIIQMYLANLSSEEEGTIDPLASIDEAFAYAHSFVESMKLLQQERGIDPQTYDYNGSYFGAGYLWRTLFEALQDVPEHEDSIEEKTLIQNYIAFLSSDYGATERAALTADAFPEAATIRTFAERYGELRAYVQSSDMDQ